MNDVKNNNNNEKNHTQNSGENTKQLMFNCLLWRFYWLFFIGCLDYTFKIVYFNSFERESDAKISQTEML